MRIVRRGGSAQRVTLQFHQLLAVDQPEPVAHCSHEAAVSLRLKASPKSNQEVVKNPMHDLNAD